METRELQKKCFLLYRSRKPRRNLYQRFLTLTEELGELADALFIRDGCKPGKTADLKGEIADIFTNLMAMAEELDVDVEKEVMRKMKNISRRK